MKKMTFYTYLGTNGTLTTPIHLPNVYCVKEFRLTADKDKKLTKDGKNFYDTVKVSQAEVNDWYEIEV